MIIRTKFFGEMEVSEENFLSFPEGILGFEKSSRFVLLDIPGNDVFRVLQDVEREVVAFVVTDPWKFQPDYDIDIPDEELQKIGITHKEQLGILAIVTMGEKISGSTMNLLAPVMLNLENHSGRQHVLTQSPYGTRHRMFPLEEGQSHAGAE